VDGRRLLPLGLGVAALLAVAGIASHGRPLSGAARGTGPAASFFDYVFTTVVLFALVITAIVVYAMLTAGPGRPKAASGRWYLASALLWMAACAGIAILFLHTKFEQRLQHVAQQHVSAGRHAPSRLRPAGSNVRSARLRWDEFGVVLALLAGTAIVLFGGRAARRAPRPLRRSHETVSLALDESLDDLRREPDIRRAIVAAYARMERALAAAGIPRRPAETPFEYLERALLGLDASAAAVHRLTDLFEWAKFSQHEPQPAMRDDAIDALLAVRDELSRPAEAAAA
jgi:drug/metabolite transporter superfamily protein YnfA